MTTQRGVPSLTLRCLARLSRNGELALVSRLERDDDGQFYLPLIAAAHRQFVVRNVLVVGYRISWFVKVNSLAWTRFSLNWMCFSATTRKSDDQR